MCESVRKSVTSKFFAFKNELFLTAIMVCISVEVISSEDLYSIDSELSNKPYSESTKRPNFIFILADDLGYGDLGVYGASDIPTPNIDALAASGIKFTDSYAISPICTPSRAGFLTGRYPARMGIHEVFHPESFTGMPDSEVTIAEVLSASGYVTGMVGKWHLGHHQKYMPLSQGFQEFYGYPYSNDMHPFYAFDGSDIAEWEVSMSSITSRLTRESIEFIESNRDEPFFLYIAQVMPHVPIAASKSFQGVSRRGEYGDVVHELDASVGKIVNKVEELGLRENTVIVFASDNGPWLIAEEDGGSSGPLRSGKRTTWEGGMRVPTIASWPGNFIEGSVNRGITTLMDWFPTFLELSGNKDFEVKDLDGISLVKSLTTGDYSSMMDRSFAYYMGGGIEAFRSGNWKVKFPTNKTMLPFPIRLFFKGENDINEEIELYNLRDDLSETVNLAETNVDKLNQLLKEVEVFKENLGQLNEPIDTGFSVGVEPFFIPGLKRMAMTVVILLLLLLTITSYIFYLYGKSKRTN